MEIQYNKCGDYYLPNLIIVDSAQRSIGKYGRLHRQYLKEHRPIIFTTLLLSGKLYEHLTEINRACTERIHPKGIVIIGNTSQLNNWDKRNSFERFRRELSNPEVITYDELYERAKFIVGIPNTTEIEEEEEELPFLR